MRKSKTVLYLSLFFWLILGITSLSYSDDATVLPKGVFSPQVKGTYFFPHSKRFDPDGHVEDIAADYNVNLDSSIFTGLAALDPFVTGPASIGNTEISMEITRTELEFSLARGVTDKLSVGIRFPYLILKNKVDARLNPGTANVGKNVALNTLLPLTVPGTEPLTTDDVQDLIGEGLDINGDGAVEVAGYGFKRFDTFSESGIGDIDVGLKYQYLKTKDWRLAATFGVRFPTGEVDDPDDLADLSFGDGQYDLLLRLHQDYTGYKNLVLNGTFRYDLQLPDHEVRRVPNNVNQPITPEDNKENVKRDLGDIFEFEVSGTYTFLKVFDVFLLYNYAFKLKDSISGDKGLAYESLENETDQSEQIIKTGLSFSTLPWFMEKTFPYPFRASLEYRNKFAGTNNVLKSQFISFTLTGFF